jgi:hypothetical protein
LIGPVGMKWCVAGDKLLEIMRTSVMNSGRQGNRLSYNMTAVALTSPSSTAQQYDALGPADLLGSQVTIKFCQIDRRSSTEW